MEEFVWSEKYRPHTISDTILPKELKAIFQGFVDKRHVSNMTLSGGPGVGKTTVARAMLEELGCDYLMINGSLNGNIDTLRNEIQQFASSMSMTGGKKYVILDEADNLNPQSTQPALRNFMQEYSMNCGFIFTCNYKNKIIKPLHSRAPIIEFRIPKEEMAEMALAFFRRAEMILKSENVEYDRGVLAQIIQKYFPDWRRAINELQKYSVIGKIDSGIFASHRLDSIKDIMGLCKEKQLDQIRKWVNNNSDLESSDIFRSIYEQSSTFFTKRSVPILIQTIAEYQYKAAFVADQEINMVAFFVELMINAEFL